MTCAKNYVSLINDTLIEYLETLRQFKSLDLSWTSVSASEVARLQEALPDCQIKRRQPFRSAALSSSS